MNRKILEIVYKRIADLENRNLNIEEFKLKELYKLETKLLMGKNLSEEEMERHKLKKYM
jgi:hypothetical protein